MISGWRCWAASSGGGGGWWEAAAAARGGRGGLLILWDSLLTLRGGGRGPWSWSSLFGDGDEVSPEGNSGTFMVAVGSGAGSKRELRVNRKRA